MPLFFSCVFRVSMPDIDCDMYQCPEWGSFLRSINISVLCPAVSRQMFVEGGQFIVRRPQTSVSYTVRTQHLYFA